MRQSDRSTPVARTSSTPYRLRASYLGAAALLLTQAPEAAAQRVSFSIDYHGPNRSLPDCGGTPISEGDMLLPSAGVGALGPLTQPCIFLTGGPGGLGLPLHGPCLGTPPGIPCAVEVDAFSGGLDAIPASSSPQGHYWYSADKFAMGIGGMPVPPNIVSEGAGVAMEGSADVYVDLGLPVGPMAPFAGAPGTTAILDGNGFRSTATDYAYPGLGLLEWNPLTPPPYLGDNVDALNAEEFGQFPFGKFFSLDSAFIDPLTGIPHSGSALAHGFVGGDVLVTVGAGFPGVYAPAAVLGLDMAGGPDSDDLDALIIWENGIPGYQPSMSPNDWIGGSTDMLLFSVRRGSALIGMPDSIFGMPIEEGDILTRRVPPSSGGVSPFPGIYMAAENLGLQTLRSGFPLADDLNAADYVRSPMNDCNGNLIEDAIDIALGTESDCNQNGLPDSCDITSGRSNDFDLSGVPDECEFGVSYYCAAKVNSLGCTPIIGSFGTPSATFAGPFDISAVNIVSDKPGILFYGYAPASIPFQGGTLCVAPPIRRVLPVLNSMGVFPPPTCTGYFSVDFNAVIQGGSDIALIPGADVYAQYWYRDPGASVAPTGLTDAVNFVIAP